MTIPTIFDVDRALRLNPVQSTHHAMQAMGIAEAVWIEDMDGQAMVAVMDDGSLAIDAYPWEPAPKSPSIRELCERIGSLKSD